jgi:hypothetical protein
MHARALSQWLAMVIVAVLPSVSAAVNIYGECVRWTASGGAPWFGSPQRASDYIWNCCSGFAPSQLPVTVGSCTTHAQGPYKKDCTGQLHTGQSTATTATGFGPVGGSVFWSGPAGSGQTFAR